MRTAHDVVPVQLTVYQSTEIATLVRREIERTNNKLILETTAMQRENHNRRKQMRKC